MAADRYELFGFLSELREWMRRENPSNALIATVAAWGAALEVDPLAGAEADGEHLLFHVVPGTEHGGRVVTLSFAVSRSPGWRGRVDCLSFRCQHYPPRGEPDAWPPEPHEH